MHKQAINNQALWMGIAEMMKGNQKMKSQPRQVGRMLWSSSRKGQYIIPDHERRERRSGNISARQQRIASKKTRRQK